MWIGFRLDRSRFDLDWTYLGGGPDFTTNEGIPVHPNINKIII